jgi:hypothetical protein
MAGERAPQLLQHEYVDRGTLAAQRTPAPGVVGDQVSGVADLESALAVLKTEAVNFGYRFIRDGAVRRDYIAKTQALVKTIKDEVRSGRLTYAEGAVEANKLRNAIMDAARLKSSDLGRASAEAAKLTGKTLVDLQEYYAQKVLKRSFDSLADAEKNRVWLEIIEGAGRQDPRFNTKAARLARVGRGFIVLSLGIAVYNITTAEDQSRQIVKEGATAGAGILGGMGGGALAGLACGPGAPVCVTIGVFVGGALAAIGADLAFDLAW